MRNSDKALVSLDFEDYQAIISHGFDTNVARTAWAVGTVYALDDIRVPITANGYQYRCAVAGTSHAVTEPTWPTDLGVRVTDNTVTWEMDGNSGDEYSYEAPMKVRVQEFHSGRGLLRCIIRVVGIPDQMAEEKAKAIYTQAAGDTNTVKTLISAICAAGTGLNSAFNGYPVITVAYDSEDGLIDTFIPAEYFSINTNSSRWDKIEELLEMTGCKQRIGNDGKLHILDPVTTGTTYDYEYKWNVSGEHTFFNKTVRLRFVEPNEEIVASHPDQGTYTGSATSAASYALDPKTHTTYARLVSNAQATSIAEAMIERYELDAETGMAIVPMNVGQELWDYVKVTDSRQGDTRVGNIQYLHRKVQIPEGEEALTFSSVLSFGKVTAQSLMAALINAGRDATEERMRGPILRPLSEGPTTLQLMRLIESMLAHIRNLYAREEYPRLRFGELFEALYANQKLLNNNLSILNNNLAILDNNMLILNERFNILVQAFAEFQNMATFRRLTVTEQLIIPAWT